MRKYVWERITGQVFEEPNVLAWAQWYETADRIVARTEKGDTAVSTVFLGVDHNFRGGPPVLFESLVFDGPHDGEMRRYHTEAEARAGHEALCLEVFGGENP